jgi:hypothetical protein
MDISYHLREIEKSIVEYSVFLEQEYPELRCTEEEETKTVDKEYKMPFEMKVFQKRLKKHTFYRNRNKRPVQDEPVADFQVTDTTEHADTGADEDAVADAVADDVPWSKLTKLSQKKAIASYIKSLELPAESSRTLILHVWDAIVRKYLKAKHITYAKKRVERIAGLICREGTWAFNLSSVL